MNSCVDADEDVVAVERRGSRWWIFGHMCLVVLVTLVGLIGWALLGLVVPGENTPMVEIFGEAVLVLVLANVLPGRTWLSYIEGRRDHATFRRLAVVSSPLIGGFFIVGSVVLHDLAMLAVPLVDVLMGFSVRPPLHAGRSGLRRCPGCGRLEEPDTRGARGPFHFRVTGIRRNGEEVRLEGEWRSGVWVEGQPLVTDLSDGRRAHVWASLDPGAEVAGAGGGVALVTTAEGLVDVGMCLYGRPPT